MLTTHPENAAHAVLPPSTQVLIVGGGPVGLTLAALLRRQGVDCVVVEADAGYCSGSRAICVSRRSQEILAWVGADAPLTAKGLAWTGGRSYYKNQEVLHFQMPSDATQRFAPMVNIQQFYVEQYAHEASDGAVMWNTRYQSCVPANNGLNVSLVMPDGQQSSLFCEYMVACDGGKSGVRESLGLKLEGMQYDGRYVIVDIVQKSRRAVERLAWFDPPSNPGSTLLMHRQPDDVWRIDYQLRDDEDPLEAVKPENVLPRVQSHLDMMGETAPWHAKWISIYNAKCLTLAQYRHAPAQSVPALSDSADAALGRQNASNENKRIFFAGDAAHLVPIFGVRGLNSGLDDAANLAWKLAHVLQGKVVGGKHGTAADALLDSYSTERVHAARENMAYGAKSTEFMAPPHHGFELLRDAALRLSTVNPAVRSLLNPRQTTPNAYPDSVLNLTPGSGVPMPEAQLHGHPSRARYLSQLWGKSYVLLCFADSDDAAAHHWAAGEAPQPYVALLEASGGGAICITPAQSPQAYQRCQAQRGTRILVRPDGYIAGRYP